MDQHSSSSGVLHASITEPLLGQHPTNRRPSRQRNRQSNRQSNRLSTAVSAPASFFQEPAVQSSPQEPTSSTNVDVYDVFISHAGEQKYSIVATIRELFRQRYPELKVLVDADELHAGGEAQKKLKEALVHAHAVVLVISKEFLTKPHPMQELHWLLERAKGTDTPQALIPLAYGVSWQELSNVGDLYGCCGCIHYFPPLKWLRAPVRQWEADVKELCRNRTFIRWEQAKTDSQRSKLVVDAAVQHLARNGCMPPEAPSVSLPSALVGLEERKEEVVRLLRQHKAVLIHGMGGIGKTTLVNAVYQQLKEADTFRLSRCCHAVLRSAQPADPHQKDLQEIQMKILDALNTEGGGASAVDSIDDGRRQIRQLVTRQKGERPVLLVVDNATGNQLRCLLPLDIMQLLPGGSMLLVASRSEHAGLDDQCQRYAIEVMTAVNARQLFCQHAFGAADVPRELSDEDAGKVTAMVDRCGGLPMAVEVLGQYLRQAVSQYGTTAVSLEHLLAAFVKQEAEQPDDTLSPLFAAFHVSFSVLDREQQLFLMEVAHHLNGESWEVVDAYYGSRPNLEFSSLDELQELSLIKSVALGSEEFGVGRSGRWTLNLGHRVVEMHDTMVEFCRRKWRSGNARTEQVAPDLTRWKLSLDSLNLPQHTPLEEFIQRSLPPPLLRADSDLVRLQVHFRGHWHAGVLDLGQLNRLKVLELFGVNGCHLDSVTRLTSLQHLHITSASWPWASDVLPHLTTHFQYVYCLEHGTRRRGRDKSFLSFASCTGRIRDLRLADIPEACPNLQQMANLQCLWLRTHMVNLSFHRNAAARLTELQVEPDKSGHMKFHTAQNSGTSTQAARCLGVVDLSSLRALSLEGHRENVFPAPVTSPHLTQVMLKDIPVTCLDLTAPSASLRQLKLLRCGALVRVRGGDELPLLETLDIDFCRNLTDVLSGCRLPALTKLEVRRCAVPCIHLGPSTGSSQQAGLCAATPSLRKLVVEGCEQLVEVKGGAEMRTLQRVKLARCLQLRHLLDGCQVQALKELRLEDVGLLDLSSVLRASFKLTQLLIRGTTALTHLDLRTAASVPLEDLCLERCNHLVEVVGASALPALKSLSVHSCDRMTQLLYGCQLPSLKDLRFTSCGMLEFVPAMFQSPLQTAAPAGFKSLSLVRCGRLRGSVQREWLRNKSTGSSLGGVAAVDGCPYFQVLD